MCQEAHGRRRVISAMATLTAVDGPINRGIPLLFPRSGRRRQGNHPISWGGARRSVELWGRQHRIFRSFSRSGTGRNSPNCRWSRPLSRSTTQPPRCPHPASPCDCLPCSPYPAMPCSSPSSRQRQRTSWHKRVSVPVWRHNGSLRLQQFTFEPNRPSTAGRPDMLGEFDSRADAQLAIDTS